MFRRLMKRAISVVLVFAMISEISTPLAYAAGDPAFDTDTTELLNSSNP